MEFPFVALGVAGFFGYVRYVRGPLGTAGPTLSPYLFALLFFVGRRLGGEV